MRDPPGLHVMTPPFPTRRLSCRPCVLRNDLRGGMAEKVSRDRYVGRGADRTRSFAEFRLLRDLLKQDLPVPRPIAASYLREGPFYRASILMERLQIGRAHV